MSTQAQVQAFITACQHHGFKINVKNENVIAIEKRFLPEDTEAFSNADSVAWDILALVPLRGGSTWGTDGLSIGGYSGLKNGHYILNKSGDGKRFVSALRKVLK